MSDVLESVEDLTRDGLSQPGVGPLRGRAIGTRECLGRIELPRKLFQGLLGDDIHGRVLGGGSRSSQARGRQTRVTVTLGRSESR